MGATELSEIDGIDDIVERAKSGNELIKLADLDAIRWVDGIGEVREYTLPEDYQDCPLVYITDDILHPMFKRDNIFGNNMYMWALGDFFKNAFEQAMRENSMTINVSNSKIDGEKIEFLYHQETNELDPVFVEYWIMLKRHRCEERSGPIDKRRFYEFSGRKKDDQRRMNAGLGLFKMLQYSSDCGFYISRENKLLCYIAFTAK
jgi:hypothetical protein